MPSPPSLFAFASFLVLPCWFALAASLFWALARRFIWPVTGIVVPSLLAIAYLPLISAGFGEAAGGGFGSIGEVRSLFASDAALTAGWLHYLAFDLLVGTLIAREGLRANVHPLLLLPCLPLTFMLGPLGFLLFAIFWLAGRRRGARGAA